MISTVLSQADSDKISAGPLGLLVVVLMGVATVLLIRNMNGRLKRLPPTFSSDGVPPRAKPPGELPRVTATEP